MRNPKKIIDACYKIATDLLNKNIDKLHAMAKALVEYETLNTDQIDDIMAGISQGPVNLMIQVPSLKEKSLIRQYPILLIRPNL